LEVDLTGNPDWMAAAAGSVWVKRDDGVVTRLDPGSGEIIADIDVKAVPNEDPCTGIGVSTDAIWSCSETSIVRIDPTTNEVTKTVPVGKIWAQGRLVHAAGRIWVLAGEGDRLVGITTADGAAAEPISLPAKCVDLGAASDVVYAACTDDDTVLRIDPATAAITKVAVKGPNHVSVAGSSAWVAAAEGLLRLEPTSLATQLTIPEIVPGAFGGILADDAAVWVRQENPFLIRVDATTGAQTRVITAPHGSGDVVVDGTRIWASDVEGNSLIRLTVPATS
jgi:DNA-binding beta-propeller fold protein YncE